MVNAHPQRNLRVPVYRVWTLSLHSNHMPHIEVILLSACVAFASLILASLGLNLMWRSMMRSMPAAA